MPLRPERLLLAAALALPFWSLPGLAQEPPAEAPAAEGEAQTGIEAVAQPGVSENIEESQPPPPTDQGMLQTEELDEDEGEAEQGVDLYTLLTHLRRAPPGLDGTPVPRPNAFASEPETEMEPVQPRDAYLFPENYIE